MLKKEKKRAADAIAQLERSGQSAPPENYHDEYAHTMATNTGSYGNVMTNGNASPHEVHDPVRSTRTAETRPPSGRSTQSAERQRVMQEREEKTKNKICEY